MFFLVVSTFLLKLIAAYVYVVLIIFLLKKGAGGAGSVPASSRPVGFGSNLDSIGYGECKNISIVTLMQILT